MQGAPTGHRQIFYVESSFVKIFIMSQIHCDDENGLLKISVHKAYSRLDHNQFHELR